MTDLSGKTAIVTGGAMGIGKACVAVLLQAGASVAIVDSNESAGEEAAADFAAEFGPAAFSRADISNAEEDRRVVEAVAAQLGRPDILVNNAGIQTFGGPVDTTQEIWDRTMETNLKGHWLMSKYTIPEMMKLGRGAIVNISSVQGLASQRNVMAYATSKHAMIGLTRSMAVDLASCGIMVNCVCPGTVDTPMIRSIISLDKDPERLERILQQMHPIGALSINRVENV